MAHAGLYGLGAGALDLLLETARVEDSLRLRSLRRSLEEVVKATAPTSGGALLRSGGPAPTEALECLGRARSAAGPRSLDAPVAGGVASTRPPLGVRPRFLHRDDYEEGLRPLRVLLIPAAYVTGLWLGRERRLVLGPASPLPPRPEA